MINLMPGDQKQAIAYARRNTMLIQWLAGIGIALAGILVITGGSLFYLRRDSTSLKTSIEESKKLLSSQKEEETLKRAEEMSGNIKLATDVLSNEILFSQLLQKIGEVMPPGTVLRSLSLSNVIASSGIDLEIGALNYESGTRAQVNLNDPRNGIFEKADLQNIECSSGDAAEDEQYPCSVSVRALFAKENPFLFISNQKGAR